MKHHPNLTNEQKEKLAKKIFDTAKVYERTTDYETALFWYHNAYELYIDCENKSLLKEIGECEYDLMKLNKITGRYEEALTFANCAQITYTRLAKKDEKAKSVLKEIKSFKTELEQRLDKSDSLTKN